MSSLDQPNKIFPCDCMSEGIMVSSEFLSEDNEDMVVISRDGKLEDEYNYYTVDFSFWGMGPYDDGKLSWWKRLKLVYYVLKHGHPWRDMVSLKPEVAKSLAYRILYMVEQMENKIAFKKDEIHNVPLPQEIPSIIKNSTDILIFHKDEDWPENEIIREDEESAK